MSLLGRLGARLYSGEVSFDFVGRRRLWYAASAVVTVVAISALFVRPLNFGIEFEGGVELRAQVPASVAEPVETMTEAVTDTGLEDNPSVVTSGQDTVRIQTQQLSSGKVATLTRALKQAGATGVSSEFIGPSWGNAVASRALLGLGVFLGLVVLFIGLYFREWKMSAAAVVALGHDVLITVGVYALTGFEVTPATITGLLTILGYSLYDTVVVFDKVRENTRGVASSTRRTYPESANLAVNQTLVRSINTSVAALLPVAALLYVGVFQLGSGPLKDLALVLFIGMAAGTYSSIFIATPLLVQLKLREPGVREQSRRGRGSSGGTGGAVARRRAGGAGCRRPAAFAADAHRYRQARSAAAQVTLPARQGAALMPAWPSLVRDVPDFPAPGVVFKDITPLLADAAAFGAVVAELAALGRDASGALRVDVVAGIEARGFILAAPVALALGVGFVPIRKEGKLPADTHAQSYDLEYGAATIEVHRDAFFAGARVLLIDDVLATGGTLAAAVALVRACQADLVGVGVLLELGFLDGRAKITCVDSSVRLSALSLV